MQNQIMGYDRTATMFSPDGHLLQVEYAEKSVRLGSASIGMVCRDGVFIISDKRVNDALIVKGKMSKIYEIDDHIMASVAGIMSDARILIEKAQVMAQQHKVVYGSEIDVESVTREISNIKQAFTQYGGARPFGVSILMTGVKGSTPSLFVSDVTGNYFSYNANAIGENDEKIREILREKYNEKLSIEQGIRLGISIFKQILGKHFNISRFEGGYIKLDEKKLKRVSGEQLKKYLK